MFEATQQAGTEEQEEDEVVEVPGLQGGVLPIVREAEKLSVIGQLRVTGLVREELPQDGQRQNRRRGRAALARETGEAIDIPTVSVVNYAALEAKSKLTGEEPIFVAATFDALGIDANRDGSGCFVGGFEDGFFSGCVQPRIGVLRDVTLELLLGVARGEKTGAKFTALVAAGVVNFAGREVRRVVTVVPNRVVFLPTVSAKMSAVEKDLLALSIGCEALRIEGDDALGRRLESAEHFARTADELV